MISCPNLSKVSACNLWWPTAHPTSEQWQSYPTPHGGDKRTKQKPHITPIKMKIHSQMIATSILNYMIYQSHRWTMISGDNTSLWKPRGKWLWNKFVPVTICSKSRGLALCFDLFRCGVHIQSAKCVDICKNMQEMLWQEWAVVPKKF